MPAAFIKPLTSFLTKAANNPKVQEAALEIGTKVIGDMAKRTLNRKNGDGPTARSNEGSAKSKSMAPQKGGVLSPKTARAEGEQASFQASPGLHRANAMRRKPAPPTYEHTMQQQAKPPGYFQAVPSAMNPDALPYMDHDGSWIEANDPRNVAHAAFAAAAAAGGDRPPTYTQANEGRLNPDALPFMNQDGSWTSANDPSNPAHARFGAQAQVQAQPRPAQASPQPTTTPTDQPPTYQQATGRPAQQRPTPLPTYDQATARPAPRPGELPTYQQATAKPQARPTARPSSPDAKATNPQGFQASIRQTLRNFFGGSGKVSAPKSKPIPDALSIPVRGDDGHTVRVRLSRSDIAAYQKATGISNENFDVGDYLKYKQARHDPMRPGDVKVSGGVDSIADLGNIDNLEINRFHTNQQLFGA